MQIDLLPPNHHRVTRLLSHIRQQAGMTYITLFGGDRWTHITVCAIATTSDNNDVGIATLAPSDEMGEGGPHIIGAWVDPQWRKSGIGTALLKALAEESIRRYGQPATVEAVTKAGWCCVQKAQKTTKLIGKDLSECDLGLLPW